MKKIYSIYFLLGLFITAFYSCGEDLTPVGPDIAEITHFRNDGPYLFYENGRLKIDRKSTRLNSSHWNKSRMPSSA